MALVGVFFLAVGYWGFTHAARSPESPAAGWMSFPAGRRVGGLLTMHIGVAVIVAGFAIGLR